MPHSFVRCSYSNDSPILLCDSISNNIVKIPHPFFHLPLCCVSYFLTYRVLKVWASTLIRNRYWCSRYRSTDENQFFNYFPFTISLYRHLSFTISHFIWLPKLFERRLAFERVTSNLLVFKKYYKQIRVNKKMV